LKKSLHDPVCELRDPVHGFVKLSEAERRIINCPTYQRLRDIRQLAMGHMVYPGANHTRFEHSIGCLHLASLVFDAVESRQASGQCPSFDEAFNASASAVQRGKKLLRLAALLHDLGHGPFSHTGESLMPEEEIGGRRRQVKHEDMTARLIRETEIARVIDQYFGPDNISVDDVIAVATTVPVEAGKHAATIAWYRFLNEMLTGELGVDRMDYLLRDAHHSGQEAGKFDFRKLIDSMTVVAPAEQGIQAFRLGLDGDGWLVGEQMVAARYLMYVALYFHKTKRAYEMHLEQFMKAWLELDGGKPFLPTASATAYGALTDSVILGAIHGAASRSDDTLRPLAMPFLDRSHFRLAKELVLADNSIEVSGRRVPDKARVDKLRTDVRMRFGNEVWIDVLDHGAAKFLGSPDMIPVSVDGETRDLAQLSEVVRGMSSQIWRCRVYAAGSERSAVREFCDKWLKANPIMKGG
jgi:HD superfamily phosphohydrolase